MGNRARGILEQGHRLPRALGGGGLWEPLRPPPPFHPLEPKVEGLVANPGPGTGPAEPVCGRWGRRWGGQVGSKATQDEEVAVRWARSAPCEMGAGPAHLTEASWEGRLCRGS